MDFTKELKIEAEKPTRSACQLSLFLSKQKPSDARDMWAAVRSRAVPAFVVWRVLAKHGYAAGRLTVQRHRTDGCKRCSELMDKITPRNGKR